MRAALACSDPDGVQAAIDTLHCVKFAVLNSGSAAASVLEVEIWFKLGEAEFIVLTRRKRFAGSESLSNEDVSREMAKLLSMTPEECVKHLPMT